MKCPGGGIGRHAGLRSQSSGEGSSPSWGTRICDCGGIGRHRRLKISRRKACRFESGQSHHIETFCSNYTGTTEILDSSRQSKDQPGRAGLPWIQAPQKVSIWIVNSVGRVPALQAGCRQFEPVTIHQFRPCSLMVKTRAYTSPKHRPDKPACAGSSPARATIVR